MTAIQPQQGGTQRDREAEEKAGEFQGALAAATGQNPQAAATTPKKVEQVSLGNTEAAQAIVPGSVHAKALPVEAKAAKSDDRGQQLQALNPMAAHEVRTAGLNTASAIAGPKPWSRDWVFDPNDRVVAEMTKNAGLSMAGSEAGSPGLAGASDDAVRNYMNELSALLASAEASEAGLVEQPESRPQGKTVTGLSGAEFIGAMNAARGENQEQSAGQENGSGSQSRGRELKLVPGAVGKPSTESSIEANTFERSLKSKPQVLKRTLDEMPNTAGAGMSHLNVTGPTNALSTQNGMAIGTQAVTGHVVQGSMARERLSSEALASVGTQIKGLGANGGEVRIRLKPENLGELHLRVATQGNSVGLQIQASDDRAKQIIEDSMSFLKESLAAQNLTLGRVDVNVGQAGSSSNSGQFNDSQRDQAAFQQQQGWGQGSQSGSQNSSGQSNGGWEAQNAGGNVHKLSTAQAASSSARSASAGTGRLNVFA